MSAEADIEFPDILLNISPTTGEAPESRLRDAEDARQVTEKLILQDQWRSTQRALVKANLIGNPPYGGRKPRGCQWEADVNFLMGRARLERACGAYTALYSSVENYCNWETTYQPENPDKPKWEALVSQGIHDLIKTWGQGFDWNMQHRVKEMTAEGYAPVMMEQGDNWRFRALEAARILVPRDTPSCIDHRCRYVLLLENMSVTDLYRKTLVPDDPRWDQEAVKWAVMHAGTTMDGVDSRRQNWEWWLQRMQHHDLRTADVDCDMVPVVHLFLNEFGKEGKPDAISHFIFTRYQSSSGNDKGIDPNQNSFLFKHVRAYDNYQQALHVFFRNIGDGYFHSVRGLSFETFKQDVVLNRLYCRGLDRAFLDSTLWIGSESSQNSDKLDSTVIGSAIVRLPPQTKIVQSGFAGQMQGVMDMMRVINNNVNSNTGAANPRTIMREDGKGEQPTLGQVRAQIAQDTQLSNDQIRMDYLAMDRLYTEMARRMTKKGTTDKEAQEFQEKMLAQGVPAEALYSTKAVYANRSAGYGSAAMRDAVMEKLSALVPMMPEDGKNNYLNMAIMSATENPSMVTLFNPQQHMPTPDDALIVLENAAIHTGETPVIFSGQNNVLHMQGHLADVEQTLTPVQQAMEAEQLDPAQLQSAYSYLEVMGPHLEAHLEPIMMDPSRRALGKLFQDQIAALTAFHGKLRQAIRTAHREAQIAAEQENAATALDAVTASKVESARVHDQIAVAKARTQMALKAAAAGQNARLSAFKTVHQSVLDTARTKHEISMDRLKEAA